MTTDRQKEHGERSPLVLSSFSRTEEQVVLDSAPPFSLSLPRSLSLSIYLCLSPPLSLLLPFPSISPGPVRISPLFSRPLSSPTMSPTLAEFAVFVAGFRRPADGWLEAGADGSLQYHDHQQSIIRRTLFLAENGPRSCFSLCGSVGSLRTRCHCPLSRGPAPPAHPEGKGRCLFVVAVAPILRAIVDRCSGGSLAAPWIRPGTGRQSRGRLAFRLV